MEKNPLVIVINRSESANDGTPFRDKTLLQKILTILTWKFPGWSVPFAMLGALLIPVITLFLSAYLSVQFNDTFNDLDDNASTKSVTAEVAPTKEVQGEADINDPGVADDRQNDGTAQNPPFDMDTWNEARLEEFTRETERLNQRTDTEVKATYVEEVQEYVTFTRTALWLIESGLSGSYDRSEDTEIYLTGVRNLGTACLFKYKYSLEEILNEKVREKIGQIEELSEHFCPEIVETADTLLAYWNEEDVVKKSEYLFTAEKVGMSAYKKQYLMLLLCDEVEREMGW